ncbi:PREDICTED: uncharacterized protein LOC101301808 [Fragaria vesca subsp. vesca]|uniref:uncharacterized protein LOC101301808 n=1 Tax=Fragaria vesca subsp. vesca TaxID=101020 RepID=UPI0002C36DAD|nr:PREDICTED: uncharacterized protein LOC101301808 [Fragaria vesca subsp. vesca]
MVSTILSSTTSSFLSNSNPYSDAFPTFNKSRPPLELSRRPTLNFPKSLKLVPFRVFSSAGPIEDGSAEQFLQNNSIGDFMRFKTGADGGTGELQTAVVSYKKKFPWSLLKPFLQVDLVSTIHIADKEYFSTLQKELESYDAVLFEMVTSKESLENRRNLVATKRLKVKSSRSRSFNILGCIQRQMAHFLSLDFQLDCMDYESEKWYHADLDFETFKLLQDEKGESFFSFARDMTIRSTKAMMKPEIPEDLDPWRSKLLWASRVLPMPLVGLLIIGGVCADTGSQPSKFPELEALSRLDFGGAMKVFLAKRLTSEFTLATADVEESSVIIGERNRACMEALTKAIDDGHNRIAILYGGGHMPDLGRRLQELDLIPSRAQWVTAWSIKNRNLNSNSLPFLKTMAEVSGWPLNRYQTLALLIFSSVLAIDLWFWELFFGTAVDFFSQIGSQVSQFIDNADMIL